MGATQSLAAIAACENRTSLQRLTLSSCARRGADGRGAQGWPRCTVPAGEEGTCSTGVFEQGRTTVVVRAIDGGDLEEPGGIATEMVGSALAWAHTPIREGQMIEHLETHRMTCLRSPQTLHSSGRRSNLTMLASSLVLWLACCRTERFKRSAMQSSQMGWARVVRLSPSRDPEPLASVLLRMSCR